MSPDIEEEPYITDIPKSKKTRKRMFRSPVLKYGGGIVAVLGIMGSAIVLWQYVWEDYCTYVVEFDPYASQLAITGSIALVGILLYLFVDE